MPHEDQQPGLLQPDPALKRLDKFVGTWDMKGRFVGADEDNISGRATFEWLPGGFFLQQRISLTFGPMQIESLEPAPLPYRWEVAEDTLKITVSYGPLDATFTGQWSKDGTTFGGGWRPNPGADETVNAAYDIEGHRAS
jgi:hypothetical protein